MNKALDSLHTRILNSKFAEEVTQEEIEALVEAKNNNWISCSERLPSEDCYCLITTSDSEIDVREYNYSKGWGWDGFERVIAWQPLPQPYKEGSE